MPTLFVQRQRHLSKLITVPGLCLLLAMFSGCPVTERNAATPSGFTGVIGRTLQESIPDWPDPVMPPKGSPNVLIWLLDDAGYAHFSNYGSRIETPTVEKLAAEGLVYTDFHSIPLCSPARAALLAGRNHHSVAMGSHIMSSAGFPGYNGDIPKSTASIAKILRNEGYATFALGKWDQTKPTAASVAGPFDTWPSGQGFERFYGFLGPEAHHFSPSLWSDHSPIAAAEDKPDYFLTTDLADKAIEYISGLRATAPGKPFLMYWATGAVHAPHHAPRQYIEKYDEVFAVGWDVIREETLARQIAAGLVPANTRLSPPHPEVPRWNSLSEPERRLYARQMAAFAGQLDHADRQFGRIVALLDSLGELDNTIIIITSDNGASGEGGMTGLHNEMLSLNGKNTTFEQNNRFYNQWGGPNTANHFHTGWGMAGNTPFPFFKHHIDGGGTHVPLIIHWPTGIKKTGVRSQYHHIIDIVPTILDAIGIQPPATIDGVPQKPFDGMSLAYSFDNPNARARRTTQYYEIWGNRGIYKDGWKAATIHNDIMPWQPPIPDKLENDVWRLYHVAQDFSQSTDLAASHPEKLKELQAAWEVEAQKYGVYPIDPNRRARTVANINRSGRKEKRIEYARQGAQRIPEALSPPVKNRSHTITADIEVENGPATQGVLATTGGITGGYALYVKDGRPTYIYNLLNEKLFYVRSSRAIPSGRSEIKMRFDKNKANNGGIASLFINGDKVGSTEIEATVRNIFSIEDGFDIGIDDGSSVTPEYTPPFSFNGHIERVVFELDD